MIRIARGTTPQARNPMLAGYQFFAERSARQAELVCCPTSSWDNCDSRKRLPERYWPRPAVLGKHAKSASGKARTTARLGTWRGFATQHGVDSRRVFGRELVGQH